MQDLTLVIPAKNESESLPIFLDEISNLKYKKISDTTSGNVTHMLVEL